MFIKTKLKNDIIDGLKDHKEAVEELYSLFEKLGQRIKNDRIEISDIIAGIMIKTGLRLDENNNVVKTNDKSKTKTVSTSRKTTKRKTK